MQNTGEKRGKAQSHSDIGHEKRAPQKWWMGGYLKSDRNL